MYATSFESKNVDFTVYQTSYDKTIVNFYFDNNMNLKKISFNKLEYLVTEYINNAG